MASRKISIAKKKRDAPVALKDVLRRNGEENLYDEIVKLAKHANQAPILIFAWKCVDEFVKAVNEANDKAAAGGAAVPPSPFRIPDPLTRDSFKKALIDHATVGTTASLGTTCLPCTFSEFGCGISKLVMLDSHPWTEYIIGVGSADVLPIADIFYAQASHRQIGVCDRPPSQRLVELKKNHASTMHRLGLWPWLLTHRFQRLC